MTGMILPIIRNFHNPRPTAHQALDIVWSSREPAKMSLQFLEGREGNQLREANLHKDTWLVNGKG